jgi:hypothetical protein
MPLFNKYLWNYYHVLGMGKVQSCLSYSLQLTGLGAGPMTKGEGCCEGKGQCSGVRLAASWGKVWWLAVGAQEKLATYTMEIEW